MKNINQSKRITTIVLSVSLLTSALTPSLSQANLWDNVKRFGCSIFVKSAELILGGVKAVKKVGAAMKRKANSDANSDNVTSVTGKGKATSLLKKCLPVVPVLAAIPVGIYLFSRLGGSNTASSACPGQMPSPSVGFSALTWAAKKLFGGALVTAGIGGAIFLAWKLFLKKLFKKQRTKIKKDVIDVLDDQRTKIKRDVTGVLNDQRKKVRKDVEEVRDATFAKGGQFLDDQRTKAKQAVTDVLDDQRTKVRQDFQDVRDETIVKGGQFLDDQRTKAKQDVTDVLDDQRAKVRQDFEDVRDETIVKGGQFLDGQRAKAKQDVTDVLDDQRAKAKQDVTDVLDDQRAKVRQGFEEVRDETIAKVKQDVTDVLDDQRAKVKQDADEFLDIQRDKTGQFLDEHRTKAKQDLQEVVDSAVKKVPGGLVRGALSSGYNTAKGGLSKVVSGIGNGFSRAYRYVIPSGGNDDAVEDNSRAESALDLLTEDEQPRRRKKPRPVDEVQAESRLDAFKSFSSDEDDQEEPFALRHPSTLRQAQGSGQAASTDMQDDLSSEALAKEERIFEEGLLLTTETECSSDDDYKSLPETD